MVRNPRVSARASSEILFHGAADRRETDCTNTLTRRVAVGCCRSWASRAGARARPALHAGLTARTSGYQPPMRSIRHKLILGTIMFGAVFGAAWWSRQQRIHTVDTVSPDVFGDAVVREA